MGEQPSVAELINNAARLDAREFDNFFSKVLNLKAQRSAPILTKEETTLLKKINRGFPEEKWQRLELLSERVEEKQLLKAQRVELEALLEAYEKFTVQRVKHLGQLATVRKVTLKELMEQLGIRPEHHG